MASLSVDEKKRFLRALEVDEEFRYAIAGKLGLLEVLKRLDRIEEELRKLWMKSLEHDKRFEEMVKRLEVLEKKLLEHDKRFEEINKRFEAIEKKLLEHDKRLEVIEKKLLEHDEKFRSILEEIRKIWLKLDEHSRRMSRIELELGALAESFYSRALFEDIREEVRARGEKILRRERNARVDNVDVDLLVETDKSVYVVEVKVKPKHEDVGALLAKADVVRRRYPSKRVIAILAGALIGGEVKAYAKEKGVEVYVY